MIRLRGGATTTDPRLDRVPLFDDRSRDYRVRDLLASAAPLRRRRSISLGPTLDQGQTSGCTGFSEATILQASPFRRPAFTFDQARDFYFAAQRRDEWPGGEYPGADPQYAGSSVLGACRDAKAEGRISGYRWVGAGSGRVIDDQIDAVRYLSDVQNGVNWYESMFDPDPAGVIDIDPGSGLAGGHAIACVDALWAKPAGHRYQLWFVWQNSWGDWGVEHKGMPGCCYVDPEQLEGLLEDDGEGAVLLR